MDWILLDEIPYQSHKPADSPLERVQQECVCLRESVCVCVITVSFYQFGICYQFSEGNVDIPDGFRWFSVVFGDPTVSLTDSCSSSVNCQSWSHRWCSQSRRFSNVANVLKGHVCQPLAGESTVHVSACRAANNRLASRLLARSSTSLGKNECQVSDALLLKHDGLPNCFSEGKRLASDDQMSLNAWTHRDVEALVMIVT